MNRSQVTPELSTCCGNHSCKTKETEGKFSPAILNLKKSPEEHLHDLTYKCTSKPGTAHSLPAVKAALELRSRIYAMQF